MIIQNAAQTVEIPQIYVCDVLDRLAICLGTDVEALMNGVGDDNRLHVDHTEWEAVRQCVKFEVDYLRRQRMTRIMKRDALQMDMFS